jgi:hypothetical protein
MEHLVRRAMSRLQAEAPAHHDALARFLNDPSATYQTIAQAMNVSETQIKNFIHRGKKKLIEYIRSEVAHTCSSPEEFQDELRYLSKFFDHA